MKQIESQFGLGSVVDGFLLKADEHYRDWFLNNFDVSSPNGSSPNGLLLYITRVHTTCIVLKFCIGIFMLLLVAVICF